MKCPICKKVSYAQGSSHLMRHLMTHVASIYHPYKCPFPGCEMKFIQAQNVKLHFVKHEQSWDDDVEKQMCHEENMRRFEEFRELAAESALKSQEDH
ncbi:hypothetical protein AAVH_14284 [Aphelenchoides avenae]|nr:hypothetical protein AAVH_14284 [Aphelenchus avenae]